MLKGRIIGATKQSQYAYTVFAAPRAGMAAPSACISLVLPLAGAMFGGDVTRVAGHSTVPADINANDFSKESLLFDVIRCSHRLREIALGLSGHSELPKQYAKPTAPGHNAGSLTMAFPTHNQMTSISRILESRTQSMLSGTTTPARQRLISRSGTRSVLASWADMSLARFIVISRRAAKARHNRRSSMTPFKFF